MESLDLIEQLFIGLEEGSKNAIRMIWSAIWNLLAERWLLIISVLFILFFAAVTKALMGRWGTLASLLYNLFYFGTLLVVGLIWGPEIFISNFFVVATAVILYPACYFLVGWILDRTGLRRKS